LLFDAALLREEAEEARSCRAYASEIATALTRRARLRWAAVATNAVGGGVGAWGSLLLWRAAAASGGQLGRLDVAAGALVSPQLLLFRNGCTFLLGGLALFDAGLALLAWDVRCVSLEVAAANGSTPPGWQSSPMLRCLAGMCAAMCVATAGVAALAAPPQDVTPQVAAALFSVVRCARGSPRSPAVSRAHTG
jgi:hypothetical protein